MVLIIFRDINTLLSIILFARVMLVTLLNQFLSVDSFIQTGNSNVTITKVATIIMYKSIISYITLFINVLINYDLMIIRGKVEGDQRPSSVPGCNEEGIYTSKCLILLTCMLQNNWIYICVPLCKLLISVFMKQIRTALISFTPSGRFITPFILVWFGLC